MKGRLCKDPAWNRFGVKNEVGFSEVADMKPPEG
jgi:hypothetical protein